MPLEILRKTKGELRCMTSSRKIVRKTSAKPTQTYKHQRVAFRMCGNCFWLALLLTFYNHTSGGTPNGNFNASGAGNWPLSEPINCIKRLLHKGKLPAVGGLPSSRWAGSSGWFGKFRGGWLEAICREPQQPAVGAKRH